MLMRPLTKIMNVLITTFHCVWSPQHTDSVYIMKEEELFRMNSFILDKYVNVCSSVLSKCDE